jgi:hypothetical protein
MVVGSKRGSAVGVLLVDESAIGSSSYEFVSIGGITNDVIELDEVSIFRIDGGGSAGTGTGIGAGGDDGPARTKKISIQNSTLKQ